jgi:hypothetical protein
MAALDCRFAALAPASRIVTATFQRPERYEQLGSTQAMGPGHLRDDAFAHGVKDQLGDAM